MVQEAFGQFWDLAVSEKYKGITGKYFDNDRGAFGQTHPEAHDETKIEKLIQITDDFLKKNIAK